MRSVFGLLLLIVIISGCANPISLHNARKYSVAAYSNLQAGDWVEAHKNFGKAMVNARLGKADDGSMAIVLYEYGRASGVLCHWTEAETSLIDAYEIDMRNDGPTHMSLLELARMHMARQEFPKAVEYFDRVLPEFEYFQADARDPLGYAAFLEDYYLALEQIGKEVNGVGDN